MHYGEMKEGVWEKLKAKDTYTMSGKTYTVIQRGIPRRCDAQLIADLLLATKKAVRIVMDGEKWSVFTFEKMPERGQI